MEIKLKEEGKERKGEGEGEREREREREGEREKFGIMDARHTQELQCNCNRFTCTRSSKWHLECTDHDANIRTHTATCIWL